MNRLNVVVEKLYCIYMCYARDTETGLFICREAINLPPIFFAPVPDLCIHDYALTHSNT